MIDDNGTYVKALQWTTAIPSLNLLNLKSEIIHVSEVLTENKALEYLNFEFVKSMLNTCSSADCV